MVASPRRCCAWRHLAGEGPSPAYMFKPVATKPPTAAAQPIWSVFEVLRTPSGHGYNGPGPHPIRACRSHWSLGTAAARGSLASRSGTSPKSVIAILRTSSLATVGLAKDFNRRQRAPILSSTPARHHRRAPRTRSQTHLPAHGLRYGRHHPDRFGAASMLVSSGSRGRRRASMLVQFVTHT